MNDDSGLNEELQIMQFLGRPLTDGEVRGSHLGKILTYLKMTRKEVFDTTIAKLALVIGMSGRQIRENYLKGLIGFGFIELFNVGHSQYWKWIGIKAVNGSEPIAELVSPPPPLKRTQKEIKAIISQENKEKRRKSIQEGICANPECDKKVVNKVYCNENCLRRFYELKGSSN